MVVVRVKQRLASQKCLLIQLMDVIHRAMPNHHAIEPARLLIESILDQSAKFSQNSWMQPQKM